MAEVMNGDHRQDTTEDEPEKYIENETLTYIFHYMKKATKDALVKCLFHFYHLDEIITAKNCLYDQYPTLGEFPVRKTSQHRSEQLAHCEDIINGAFAVDGEESKVVFVARKLNRLPKFDPCETDFFSLAEKYNQLEARMGNLEITVSENKAELLQVKDNCTHTQAEKPIKPIVPEKATAAEIVSRNPPGGAFSEPDAGSRQTTRPNLHLHAAGSGQQGGSMSTKPKNIPVPPSGRMIAGSNTDESTEVLHKGSVPRYDKEGYEVPYLQRKKQAKRQRLLITGSKSGGNRFKGAPPPSRDFFIYRVDNDTSTDDIIDFLNDNTIAFRDVIQMSKIGSTYKSFKLVVPMTEYDKVVDEDLWPEGIKVRRFLSRRYDNET
jgi:hypothetical protein